MEAQEQRPQFARPFQSRTLRCLAGSSELYVEPASERAVRDQVRHLIVNHDFNLDARWDKGKVPRGAATINADILVVHTPVVGLTHSRLRQALERLAVANFLGGWNIEDYMRIRLHGNRNDVGFWDEQAGAGVTLVDREELDLTCLNRRGRPGLPTSKTCRPSSWRPPDCGRIGTTLSER